MAQKIVSLCDAHLLKDEVEVAGTPITLSIDGQTKVLDMCEAHRAQYIDDLAALLTEAGRPVSNERSRFAWQCPQCDRSFSSKSGLGRHSVVHVQVIDLTTKRSTSTLVCPIDQRPFRSRQALSVHADKMHDTTVIQLLGEDTEGMAKCSVCGRAYSSLKAMEDHARHRHGKVDLIARSNYQKAEAAR